MLLPLLTVLTSILWITLTVNNKQNNRNTKLVRWFRDNGGWLHPHIRLQQEAQRGNTLATTHPIPRNETMIKVPNHLILSRTSILQSYPQFPSTLEDEYLIALALLHESCQATSFWDPYLNVLRQGSPPLLLFTFTDDELEWLQDTSLTQMAHQHRQELREIWTRVEPISSCWNFENFGYWYSLAQSHIMTLDNSKYLVPMADLINHEHGSGPFADYHARSKDHMVVRADRPLTHHVYEAYAQLDNSLYLLYFGFVPEENPYHCSMVEFPALPGFQTQTTLCVHRDGSFLDNTYIQYYRLLEYPEQAEACRCRQLGAHDRCDELAERQLVRQAAQHRLDTYPTTIPEDYQLLLNRSISPRQRLALQYRLAEKELVQHLANPS